MAELTSLIVNGKLNANCPVWVGECSVDNKLCVPLGGKKTIGMLDSSLDSKLVSARHLAQYIELLKDSPYDPHIYVEPDGSMWVHVFHHNNPKSYLFSSSNNFANGVYIDSNRWYYLDTVANKVYHHVDSNYSEPVDYQFMVVQTATSGATPKVIRWRQTVKPRSANYNNTTKNNVTKYSSGNETNIVNSVTNYTTMRDYDGGLYYNNGTNGYLVHNNGTNGNWWGCVGCWNTYQGGIPGFCGDIVTTGCIDIYIKVWYDEI